MLPPAMGKPHVLINATALSETGGGRSYSLNLLRELNEDDRGFDFTIVTVKGRLGPEAIGRFPLVEISLPPRFGALARVLYEQTALPLRAGRFDLLYCPADLLPFWSRVPVVVSLRNLNIYDRRFYDTPRTRLLNAMVQAGLRNAQRVVFPSAAAADQIRERVRVDAERVRVVHHGIAMESFEGAADPPATDVRYLFLAANLERHKNFETLFEALLRVRNTDLQLWLAGGYSLDPDWAGHLRELVAGHGLEERVRFLGPVPYAEVLGYYRGAAALVFPSLLETFGHPLLEAMLAGTPIVASDLPAFEEIAQDAALYFPARDPDALATAIDRVVDDPEGTRERVEKGRVRVQDFTWKSTVDSLCGVFGEVLRSR